MASVRKVERAVRRVVPEASQARRAPPEGPRTLAPRPVLRPSSPSDYRPAIRPAVRPRGEACSQAMYSCSGAGAGELGAEGATLLSSTGEGCSASHRANTKRAKGRLQLALRPSVHDRKASRERKLVKELNHGVSSLGIVRLFISEKLSPAKKSSNMGYTCI